MNDFCKGYILSYFKDHQQEYSFHEIAKGLGKPVLKIDELVEELISEKMLIYNSENMLVLTPEGRVAILNEQIDYYPFDRIKNERNIIHPEKALSLTEIYIPDRFLSKLR